MRCAWGGALGLLVASLSVGCGESADSNESEGGGGSGGTASSSGGTSPTGAAGAPTSRSGTLYGEEFEGQFHLGPVDLEESQWHNACAPESGYRAELREATGLSEEYLAGISEDALEGGSACDACIEITTESGQSIVARVVTYGATHAPGDIDVSPSVFAEIDPGDGVRRMSWRFASCPDAGNLVFEFQTEAHEWWSSLWVRNPRVPIDKVEVQSANHEAWFELLRGGDGTFTDAGGFGSGAFTLRVTTIDGQTIEEDFETFPTGELIESDQQFD